MKPEEIVKAAERLKSVVRANTSSQSDLIGPKAQVVDFLSRYAGPKSPFAASAEDAGGITEYVAASLVSLLDSFIDHIKAGLFEGVSPERKAQLEVVSDLLEQAYFLLENKKVHPASAAVLIGATLEEFLRTWIESENLSLGGKKPGLDNYAKVLRENHRITKQDVKDITSWAGIRNHAAHGEWDEVSDRNRIRLMLESINLFMRKYG